MAQVPGDGIVLSRSLDYYDVLCLSPEATFQEVQQAYWRRAFGGLHAADRAALNEAYEVLGNERRRREYDEARTDLMERCRAREGGASGRQAPLPPPDAGLRGRLGWPSV